MDGSLECPKCTSLLAKQKILFYQFANFKIDRRWNSGIIDSNFKTSPDDTIVENSANISKWYANCQFKVWGKWKALTVFSVNIANFWKSKYLGCDVTVVFDRLFDLGIVVGKPVRGTVLCKPHLKSNCLIGTCHEFYKVDKPFSFSEIGSRR